MPPPRTAPRLVLDTNVLVSGFLTPMGASARLVDLAQRGEVRLLYDDRIFWEYAEVLRRPRFGFSPSAADVFLEFLKTDGELVVASALPLLVKDPSDQPFLEVAVSGRADLLVTGNRKHFPGRTAQQLRIVGPAQALEFLTASF